MAETNTTHVSTTLGTRMANNIYNSNNNNSNSNSNRVYEVKPTKAEIMIWYLYEFCSYFVHTVLIPLVFPLIISQTVSLPTVLHQSWFKEFKDLKCSHNEMLLYEGLVQKAIHLGVVKISPLEWTSISWILGLILSAPVLGVVSIHLDYGHSQQVVAGLATAIGALFCLPAGFFRTPWIFLPYIALIVTAITIVGAAHARHLGLMILGFTGSSIPRRHFANRRAFGSWLSLNSTAAGSVGAAVMAAFTYLMLRRSDHFTALWVVSIFSGLIWAVGMIHICSTDRSGGIFTDSSANSSPMVHVVSIFRYPHAVGSFLVVLLSAFVAMSVFGGGLLHAMGNLCVKSENILFLWLVYFMFPVLSLPLTHPLQQKLKLDAEKMQLLGFVLSIFTSGFGFYFRQSIWSKSYMLLFAAIQGTATGLMHAFGRVLLLDCSPAGKEGAFSVWFSWARALGTCAGFALATAMPRNIGKTFGVSFVAGIIGMVVLIFGNISSFRGAKAAGHVMSSEKGSPVHELHNVADNHQKGTVRSDVLTQGKAEV